MDRISHFPRLTQMSAIIRILREMKRYFLNSSYERGGETPQTEVNPICQTKTYFATDV
jgi:hypothetical protein